MKHINSFYNRI